MRVNRRRSAASSRGPKVIGPVASPPATFALSHDAIARRAYLKWQTRGRRSGTALQDWLEAEAELKSELSQGRRG